jgi:2-polyprenyl-3-methyl-5-hydroxy-6-metoxy-1,4-benzoquinol methylase
MKKQAKNKVEMSSSFYNKSFLSIDYELCKFNFQAIRKYFKGDVVIEMGPALGQMTKYIAPCFKELHLIEGSKELIEQIPDYSNATKHNFYFEEFDKEIVADTIVMSHVLEHLEYPIEILTKFKKFLANDGVFLISVPNAKSIHRLVAQNMGLIDSIYSLNERDHELGHYRVYDMELLIKDCEMAGYDILDKGGVFLKPLSNGQIESTWTSEMINSFNNIGNLFPDNCAEIFVVLKKKKD